MTRTTVTVSEIFGPVIQGEGPLIGRPTLFVRTGGCDDRCSWCDSLYAVLPEHARSWQKLQPAEIITRLEALQPPPYLVTLSGGNPALQEALGDVIILGRQRGYTFACETQGTVAAPWFGNLNHLILSPKPPSSGNPTDLDKVANCLSYAASPVAIKIVIDRRSFDDDLTYATQARERFRTPLFLQVCNPLGPDGSAPPPEQQLADLRALSERVIALGWRDVAVLPQLHVLTYGAERGR